MRIYNNQHLIINLFHNLNISSQIKINSKSILDKEPSFIKLAFLQRNKFTENETL